MSSVLTGYYSIGGCTSRLGFGYYLIRRYSPNYTINSFVWDEAVEQNGTRGYGLLQLTLDGSAISACSFAQVGNGKATVRSGSGDLCLTQERQDVRKRYSFRAAAF